MARIHHNRGFTMIELVFVIIVIAIVSINVVPRWTAGNLNLGYEVSRVVNDIRYAQAMSMMTGLRYRWAQTSSNTYQILNASGSAILLPNGKTSVTLSSPVVIAGLANLPNNLIAFDAEGTPYTTASLPGTTLNTTASITLSSGANSQTIQILPGTGFCS